MVLLRRLSTATAATTLALVAVGGMVRATGSGLGCPDWPRCHGRLVPPLEYHALIEYSHRLTAAVVGILVIATAWVAWRRARGDRAVLWPAVAAVGVVLVQAALGRMVVVGELRVVALNMAHFLTAMLLVALVVTVATGSRLPPAEAREVDPRFRRLLWWTIAATAVLLLAGVYVRAIGASLAFLDWPLMDGRLVPDVEGRHEASHILHRLLALVALGFGTALAVSARRVAQRSLRLLAWAALALLVSQTLVGAAAVLTRLATAAVAAHVVLGSLAWATLVTTGVIVLRLGSGRRQRSETGRGLVGAYVQLMKPDIIVLLLITTVPAMILAAKGMPPSGLIWATLLGGTLTAGGAGAINGYLDRDIDEVMARTRGRPIPSHRVTPEQAMRFGAATIAAGGLWLALTVNPLAAALAVAAAAFYVFVYTAWMKRSTPQNIVIGGAAGAAPALIGWAAVTGRVEMPAVVLFAMVFYWTPPHFWALSLKYTGQYRAAGIPMLPVVRGEKETARHILLYSLLLFSVSLLLFPMARMGAVYLGSAVLLGGVFIGYAVRVARGGGTRAAMSLFHYSITYLALLFAAVAVDQLVRAGG